jgi:hypothetical protein
MPINPGSGREVQCTNNAPQTGFVREQYQKTGVIPVAVFGDNQSEREGGHRTEA